MEYVVELMTACVKADSCRHPNGGNGTFLQLVSHRMSPLLHFAITALSLFHTHARARAHSYEYVHKKKKNRHKRMHTPAAAFTAIAWIHTLYKVSSAHLRGPGLWRSWHQHDSAWLRADGLSFCKHDSWEITAKRAGMPNADKDSNTTKFSMLSSANWLIWVSERSSFSLSTFSVLSVDFFPGKF